MSSTNAHVHTGRQAQAARWRIRVIAESDPGALARILQPFQSLNVVPCSLRADRLGDAWLEIAVEIVVAELSPEACRLVTAKLAQLPLVMTAVLCD